MTKLASFSWEIFNSLCKQNFLQSGKAYLIAISGGCDSVALSRLFHSFLKKMDFKLELVHFHHGIRQKSDVEADFVLALAKKLFLKCHLFKTKSLRPPAIQKKAREWRYQKLEMLKQKENFAFVVLGHQLEDLVETQIWRLLRGTSLFDLATILPKQKFYLRPLLYTSKLKIQDYLHSIKQDWVEDASNLEDSYTRNSIRKHLLPAMQNILLPEKSPAPWSAEKQTVPHQFLEKMLALHKEAIELQGIYQTQTSHITFEKGYLNFEELQKLPCLFAQRVIHDFLISQKIDSLLRVQIENIYQLVLENKGNWELKLSKNRVVEGRNKKIFIRPLH